jgi:hypothetical protein
VLLDAHNCYPYNGRWADRLDRALGTGLPLAIEQDLFWYTDKVRGQSWSIVTHGTPADGSEPTLREYFLERIRPLMEQALKDNERSQWPLVTLNLDFKSDEPEHLAAVWHIFDDYQEWLSTAERVTDARQVQPVRLGPLLVLTGESDAHERVFHDAVPAGARLRIFGAVHVNGEDPLAPPQALVQQHATNYRRWWNNPWKVIERGGQQKAGAWTSQDAARLRELVRYAHQQELWIRFYTLNGHSESESRGWDKGYNFGSLARVVDRWRAAIDAGVDFIATDQYEQFAAMKNGHSPGPPETAQRAPANVR